MLLNFTPPTLIVKIAIEGILLLWYEKPIIIRHAIMVLETNYYKTGLLVFLLN